MTCTRSLVAAQPAALAVTDLAQCSAAGEPRVLWHERRIGSPIPSLALIQVFEEAMDNGSDVEEESDDEVEPCGGQKTVQPWKGAGAGRCEAEVATLTGMKLRKTWCPRSAAAWSWQMKRAGEEWRGEQMAAAGAAAGVTAGARSLPGQMTAQRLRVTARQRARTLVQLAAATMESGERTRAEQSRSTWVAQAALGQVMSLQGGEGSGKRAAREGDERKIAHSAKAPVQGVRRGEHLPAPSGKEQMQRV